MYVKEMGDIQKNSVANYKRPIYPGEFCAEKQVSMYIYRWMVEEEGANLLIWQFIAALSAIALKLG